jgi:hypothetical protein
MVTLDSGAKFVPLTVISVPASPLSGEIVISGESRRTSAFATFASGNNAVTGDIMMTAIMTSVARFVNIISEDLCEV